MDLSTTEASNVIALTLGPAGIWLGSVQPRLTEWRASRHAEITFRFEYYWRRDTERMQSRFVFHNQGPCRARDITIEKVLSAEGDELDPSGSAVNWIHPADVLQPGQDHCLIVERTLSDPQISQVVASWRDDAGLKKRSFAVSQRYL